MPPILPTKLNDSLQVLNTLKPAYKVRELLFLFEKKKLNFSYLAFN
jgi:hypothetical protein